MSDNCIPPIQCESILLVRDYGELNRLISLIGKKGADLSALRDKYSWRSVKGLIYSSQTIISFAEIFDLVMVTNNEIFLTSAAGKFRELGKSSQYELTTEQLEFPFSLISLSRTQEPIFPHTWKV